LAYRSTASTICGTPSPPWALDAGEPLEAVSRALGHTSLATTADIYGHWTPAMQDRLAQRMDTVLGG
jgi:integrase